MTRGRAVGADRPGSPRTCPAWQRRHRGRRPRRGAAHSPSVPPRPGEGPAGPGGRSGGPPAGTYQGLMARRARRLLGGLRRAAGPGRASSAAGRGAARPPAPRPWRRRLGGQPLTPHPEAERPASPGPEPGPGSADTLRSVPGLRSRLSRITAGRDGTALPTAGGARRLRSYR